MYISNQGMLKERRTRDNERVRKENHVRAVKWNGIQRSCKIFGFVPVQRVGIYLERKEEDKKRNLQQKGLRILKGYGPTFHAGASARQFSEFFKQSYYSARHSMDADMIFSISVSKYQF